MSIFKNLLTDRKLYVMLNIHLMYSICNKENYPFSACCMLLSCLAYSSKLKVKVKFSSKTSVKFKRSARWYIAENITPLMLKVLTVSHFFIRKVESRDRAVGIATVYGLDHRGFRVRVPVEARLFSVPLRPDRFWGPPSLLPNGYRPLFPWAKRLGSETDHSPPTSAEVKIMWIYTSTPPYELLL
jgi:hypothetical protein